MMRYYWKITHEPREYTYYGSTVPGLCARPLGHEDPGAAVGIATEPVARRYSIPKGTYWVSYPIPCICDAWLALGRRVYNYDPVKKRGKPYRVYEGK